MTSFHCQIRRSAIIIGSRDFRFRQRVLARRIRRRTAAVLQPIRLGRYRLADIVDPGTAARHRQMARLHDDRRQRIRVDRSRLAQETAGIEEPVENRIVGNDGFQPHMEQIVADCQHDEDLQFQLDCPFLGFRGRVGRAADLLHLLQQIAQRQFQGGVFDERAATRFLDEHPEALGHFDARGSG